MNMAKKILDKKMLGVLRGSTKFKTDVSLVIFRFDPEFLVKFFQNMAKEIDRGRVIEIPQGTSAIVLLCEESLAKELSKKYPKQLIAHKQGMIAFTIMFPKKATETPGIMAFLTDMFAKNKINIYEMISCYTDVTFVIDKKHLFKTMDLLGEFVL